MPKMMLMLWRHDRHSWCQGVTARLWRESGWTADQVSMAPAPPRSRFLNRTTTPAPSHWCHSPTPPVDSIQLPALALREAADSAFPPVAPAFAWHPCGWLETPELLPPTVLAHVMGMYELRACSCLLLREQWLGPHGYIQGQIQLRLFIWENLSNLDTRFYAPELRQVALDLKGAKTYASLGWKEQAVEFVRLRFKRGLDTCWLPECSSFPLSSPCLLLPTPCPSPSRPSSSFSYLSVA